MKEKLQDIKKYFWSSVILLTLMSLTFIAMPAADYVDEGKVKIFLAAIGAIFWVTLVGGYVLWFMAYRLNKTIIQEKILLNLFSNRIVSIADGMFIGGAAVLFLAAATKKMEGFLPYIILTILTLSVNLHCMFNGNIYRTITKKTRRKDDEKKDAQ